MAEGVADLFTDERIKQQVEIGRGSKLSVVSFTFSELQAHKLAALITLDSYFKNVIKSPTTKPDLLVASLNISSFKIQADQNIKLDCIEKSPQKGIKIPSLEKLKRERKRKPKLLKTLERSWMVRNAIWAIFQREFVVYRQILLFEPFFSIGRWGAINNIPLKVKQTRDYVKRYKRKRAHLTVLRLASPARDGNEKGLIGSSLFVHATCSLPFRTTPGNQHTALEF